MKRSFRSKTRSVRRKQRNLRRKIKRYNRKKYTSTRFLTSNYVFPNKMYAKLKFEEYGNMLHSDNSAPYYYRYRGNQPHKPSDSGTGTCTGYAQLETAYQNVTVIGSSIKVFFTDTNTTLVTNIPAVIVRPELMDEAPLDMSQFRNINEVKHGKLRIIEPSSSSRFTRTTIKSYMSTKTMYGISGKEVKEDFEKYGMTTGYTEKPTRHWWWTLYLACPWNTTSVTAQLHYRVLITYYCLFTKPILIPTI